MKSLQDLNLSTVMDKINYETAAEKNAFRQELTALLSSELSYSLVKKNTIVGLFDLFQILSSEQSSMHAALFQKLQNKDVNSIHLLSYFKQLELNSTDLGLNAGAAEVFIHLCSREIQTDYLQKLINCNLLKAYSLVEIQRLKGFYMLNLETLIEFYSRYGSSMDQYQKASIFKVLSMIYPTMLDTLTVQEIHQFILEIQPIFKNRIQSFLNDSDDIAIPAERLVEWMMVWKRHSSKEEKDIPEQDPYYLMEFATIVKYIPPFIWWNNGMQFRSGDKYFYFGSKAFCHLGAGGSVRDAPIKYPFTRRMAKVFVNLPVHFDPVNKNMYIHCFVQSLKAGISLSNHLQNFIRHPEDPAELEIELARWHPVIQKLVGEEFEQLEDTEAHQFLGYLYHCLRDQPGFSVQRRSVRNLLQDSQVYHDRIAQRQQRREAERIRRAAIAKELNDGNSWKSSRKIKPYEKGAFTIEELTNQRALELEGSVMKHCVGSYTNRCMNGHTSIWSLRELRSNRKYSCVTIELFKDKQVIQMSAPFNARPKKEHRSIILEWVKRENIIFE